MLVSSTSSMLVSAYDAHGATDAIAADTAETASDTGDGSTEGSATTAAGKDATHWTQAVPTGDLHPEVRDRALAASGAAAATTGKDKAAEATSPAVEVSDEVLAQRQAVVEDAVKHGRRIEEVVKLGDLEFRRFTEILPGPGAAPMDGDSPVFARRGFDIVKPDGEIERHTTYLNPQDLFKPGRTESIIKNGVETFTWVDPGSAGIDFKPGDQRPAPTSTSTKAGLLPQTADPKRDGSLGTSNSSNTQTPGAKVSGTPPEWTAGVATQGGTHGAAHPREATGSGDATVDGDTAEEPGDAGTKGAAEGAASAMGGATGDTEENVNGDEACHDRVDTYHRDSNDDSWEEGTAKVCTPPTQVEVVEPDDSDANERVAGLGDGYDGSATSGQLREDRSPIDFGNPLDPAASGAPEGETRSPIGNDPWVTDPAPLEGGDETGQVEQIRIEVGGALKNYGNPLNDGATAPGGGQTDPGTAERKGAIG